MSLTERIIEICEDAPARVSAKPDAASVLRQLDSWFEHYNRMHPHKALGYRSPREFRKQIVEKATENTARKAARRGIILPHHPFAVTYWPDTPALLNLPMHKSSKRSAEVRRYVLSKLQARW